MSHAEFIPPNRFRIVRRLGEGGMGVVYEAQDTERGARVALKTLRQTNPDSLMRFKREFRTLQDVQHPNLVSLGELISEGHQWFFTMELVEGVDFLDWVRPPPLPGENIRVLAGSIARARHETGGADATVPFAYESALNGPLDETRLRAALPQLAQALIALHDAGKIHRDIKPSNIRVTHDGRVVLLDFGLVADDLSDSQSVDLTLVGTPAYMAPEQAASKAAGPEADWYSVGVVLYEILTGRLPHEGTPLQMMMRKQELEPPAPSALIEDVPDDLEALCMRLLRFDPGARPTGQELLRRLYVPSAQARPLRSSASFAAHAKLVGRVEETAILNDAAEHVAHGEPSAIFVEGPSGIGKSCLVRKFCERLVAENKDVVVLAGRCYERESVPYKALDGVVDALSRWLARLESRDATSFLPDNMASLARVFPVLRRVRAIAGANPESTRLDPHELRRRAFDALRECFIRIARHKRLIVVVDDLQWADEDSLAMLRSILRRPDAPRMLLLATARSAATSSEGSLGAGSTFDLAAPITDDIRHIKLARLTHEEATELARNLLRVNAPDRIDDAELLAREANGHPLFVEELVQHAATTSEGKMVTPSLDEALWTRISWLDQRARHVMELVCIAGAPTPQEVVAAAAKEDPGAFARIVSLLRTTNLVQTTGARYVDPIEPFHDRIRSAVLSHMQPAAKREAHEHLALALEASPNADPQALATHWRGAQDTARAARYVVAAAERAANALAFDRAARFYRLAQELLPADDPSRRLLRVKLGDALASAGRGAAAATEYRAACAGASDTETLELRRRAAEQLLRSGHFDDALDVARGVVASVGMRLPKSPRAALWQFIFLRVFLWLRGWRFTKQDASQISARELVRVDTCWSLGLGLAMIEHLYGSVFTTRGLLLALRAGETARIVRALGMEIGFRGASGELRGALAMAERAKALMGDRSDPYLSGLITGNTGSAYYLTGHFREAVPPIDEGEELLRLLGGAAWEITTIQIFRLSSLAYLGDARELRRHHSAGLEEARARGDLFAEVNHRIGYGNLVWLIDDDPNRARAELTGAMRGWSKQGFHLEHYYELLAWTNADLYAGDVERAHARVIERRPALRRSLLVGRVPLLRHAAAYFQARAALALAAKRSKNERALLLREVDAAAGTLSRSSMAWAKAVALLTRAGATHLRGDQARARTLLEQGIAACDALGMKMHVALAQSALGELRGDDQGRAMKKDAEARLLDHGFKSPARMAGVFMPGFGQATSKTA